MPKININSNTSNILFNNSPHPTHTQTMAWPLRDNVKTHWLGCRICWPPSIWTHLKCTSDIVCRIDLMVIWHLVKWNRGTNISTYLNITHSHTVRATRIRILAHATQKNSMNAVPEYNRERLPCFVHVFFEAMLLLLLLYVSHSAKNGQAHGKPFRFLFFFSLSMCVCTFLSFSYV